MVSSVEGQVLAPVVLTELQFNDFPSIIELISVLVNVEEIEMVIKPCRVLAHISELVPSLLELEHIERCLGPLAARKRKFFSEACRKFFYI